MSQMLSRLPAHPSSLGPLLEDQGYGTVHLLGPGVLSMGT